jgi:hypothetical protein
VLSSNAYGYGGGTCARVWLTTPTSGQKIVVDLVDSGNLAGYVEASRLVAGNYFEPAQNADFGASITSVDSSKQYRNDAGDLMTDYGTRHRRQSIQLSQMAAADRASLWNIFYANGIVRPMFLSLYPNSTDNQLEQQHQMYCKLVANPSMSTPYYNRYNTSMDFEEM